jgi:hypothetical protein
MLLASVTDTKYRKENSVTEDKRLLFKKVRCEVVFMQVRNNVNFI